MGGLRLLSKPSYHRGFEVRSKIIRNALWSQPFTNLYPRVGPRKICNRALRKASQWKHEQHVRSPDKLCDQQTQRQFLVK